MTADLKTFIRRAMARGERIDVGQFRLLNLNAVREQAGENWPSVKKKALVAGTQFLAKRLDEDDAVIPCEEGFLVLFASAPDNPADMLAALSEALMRFFLGSPDTADLSIETEASRVDASDITQLAATRVATAPDMDADARRSRTQPPMEPEARLPRSCPVTECEEDSVIAQYRPLWDAQKQLLAANACLAKVVIGGRALEGRRAIATRMSRVSQMDLDSCAIDAATAMLLALARKQKRMTLRVAIHASCWANDTHRATLLDTINGLPAPLRKSLLVRIDGLSDQPAKQAAALAELGKHGVGLMAEIPFGETELGAFAQSGVSLFSCASPPPMNANSEGLMDHDARALNQMVKAAAALKAATYLHDVRDLHVLKAAMASGVRFFSGQTVVADRAAPAPGQALSMIDLYRMHKAA
ncbi:hypothetical protein [Maricaulis maris]|uniref:EAL domain-containing protein n=1 Tax=Maricaulis maris TaxID=74318 RepID=A0A495DKC3_9PROT|nr:hypothetical protein [Maricaulis maris]RKR03022.1 hypothetical protein C7435_0970 [Maricaulis maris]